MLEISTRMHCMYCKERHAGFVRSFKHTKFVSFYKKRISLYYKNEENSGKYSSESISNVKG